MSLKAQIKDKIMMHHLSIHFIASYATSEMGMGRLRGEGSETGVAG